jgi:hypothetical protein
MIREMKEMRETSRIPTAVQLWVLAADSLNLTYMPLFAVAFLSCFFLCKYMYEIAEGNAPRHGDRHE